MSVRKIKRVLNFRMASPGKVLEVMRALGELDTDLTVESCPGSIEIKLHGTASEIRKLEHEIANLVKGNPHRAG